VSHKGGVTRRFLAYSSPSRSPDPAHLAVLNRPGFVRAAPTLPGITRLRLPSAPPPCCDRTAVKVSHLHSNHSASRRTHDCRHTAGTTFWEATLNLKQVASWLGHSSVAVTEKLYVHDREAVSDAAADLVAAYRQRQAETR
jgi:hypothetical protein